MPKEAGIELSKQIRDLGGRALAVGGFVRDRYLNLPSKDLDLEVHGLASLDALQTLLSQQFKVQAAGRSFGVLKVYIRTDMEPIDISLPRREIKVGTGHKGFEVELDPFLGLKEAFRRRDLTLNALGLDLLTGEEIDPFDGRLDIENRRLRAVDPKTFVEDPLRALRVAQFAARFDFSVDEDLVKLCSQLDLSELPRERTEEEFEKLLLKGHKPSLGLYFMRTAGLLRFFPVLDQLDPEAFQQTAESLDRASQPTTSEAKDLAMLHAVLVHRLRSHEARHAFLQQLTAQRQLLEKIEILSEYWEHLFQIQSDADLRHLAAKAPVNKLIQMARAIRPEQSDMLKEIEAQSLKLGVLTAAPQPLLFGRDLLTKGLKPGIEMGNMLKRAFKAQLDGAYHDRQEALVWLQQDLMNKN